MAFCEQCGTKLSEGEKFCSDCGKPVPAEQNETPVANTSSEKTEKTEPLQVKITSVPVANTVKTVQKSCVKCGENLEPDWVICPFCKTEKGPKLCACGKELEQEWVACPYCKKDV